MRLLRRLEQRIAPEASIDQVARGEVFQRVPELGVIGEGTRSRRAELDRVTPIRLARQHIPRRRERRAKLARRQRRASGT